MVQLCPCCFRLVRCKLIAAVCFLCAGAFMLSLVVDTYGEMMLINLSEKNRKEVEECIKFILDRLIEAKDDGPGIEASDMTGDTACGRTDIRGVLIAFISSIAQATTVAVCGIICLCVALVSLCLLCCGHSATAQATDPSPPAAPVAPVPQPGSPPPTDADLHGIREAPHPQHGLDTGLRHRRPAAGVAAAGDPYGGMHGALEGAAVGDTDGAGGTSLEGEGGLDAWVEEDTDDVMRLLAEGAS